MSRRAGKPSLKAEPICSAPRERVGRAARQTAPDTKQGSIGTTWDRDRAVRTAMGNADLADDLLQMLVSELPSHLTSIRKLQQHGKLHEVAETAHTIAGGAAFCATPGLQQASLDLERAAGSGKPKRLLEATQVLELEAQRLLELHRRFSRVADAS